jgi:hypothetical protein
LIEKCNGSEKYKALIRTSKKSAANRAIFEETTSCLSYVQFMESAISLLGDARVPRERPFG